MIDSRDRQDRATQVSLRRASLRHVGLLAVICVTVCAVTGCGHQGLLVHGDWSIGVTHVPWDECGSGASCGSRGSCRHGRSVGHRGGGYASKPPVHEYEGIPTVPRFHPVPTSPVLIDPAMSSAEMLSPTPAEPLPAPPREYDDEDSAGDMDDSLPSPAADAPPELPHELDTGRHRPRPTHQQASRQRRSGRTPSRWAYRDVPSYYPQRR